MTRPQVPSIQSTSSQVSGVTGPLVTDTSSSGSVVQEAGTSGTGFGSQVIGSLFTATGSQVSPVASSPALGP